jgi:hypothetical protein
MTLFCFVTVLHKEKATFPEHWENSSYEIKIRIWLSIVWGPRTKHSSSGLKRPVTHRCVAPLDVWYESGDTDSCSSLWWQDWSHGQGVPSQIQVAPSPWDCQQRATLHLKRIVRCLSNLDVVCPRLKITSLCHYIIKCARGFYVSWGNDDSPLPRTGPQECHSEKCIELRILNSVQHRRRNACVRTPTAQQALFPAVRSLKMHHKPFLQKKKWPSAAVTDIHCRTPRLCSQHRFHAIRSCCLTFVLAV